MESKKQSGGDIVKAECSSAGEEEEMETFFALIRRFGELRKKKDELLMVHRPNADAEDHDHKNKRIKRTVTDQNTRKEEERSISCSNWVPSFRLEDFGLLTCEDINNKPQQQEVTINRKELMLIPVGDKDDVAKHHEQDDDLNLKLAL